MVLPEFETLPSDGDRSGRDLGDDELALPRLRFPVYHTMSHLVPDRLFQRSLAALLRSDLPVCYEFHAADLLDLADDGGDARMSRHPGMREPLARKRARLRDTFATITAARRRTTHRAALESDA